MGLEQANAFATGHCERHIFLFKFKCLTRTIQVFHTFPYTSTNAACQGILKSKSFNSTYLAYCMQIFYTSLYISIFHASYPKVSHISIHVIRLDIGNVQIFQFLIFHISFYTFLYISRIASKSFTDCYTCHSIRYRHVWNFEFKLNESKRLCDAQLCLPTAILQSTCCRNFCVCYSTRYQKF